MLEAVHIRPYSDGGTHEAKNGLLLRSDIHKLFDNGYVTVDQNHHFVVSRKIHEEYRNGKVYYSMHGSEILLPEGENKKPDAAALRWHNENRFRE